MNSIVICLIVTIAIVWGIGYLDFPHTFVARILTLIRGKEVTPDRIKLPKLLCCHLCCTFWCTLVILLIMSPHLCWFSMIFAFSTKYILYAIQLLDRVLTKVFILLERLCNKI
jgi:hypothetical protein